MLQLIATTFGYLFASIDEEDLRLEATLDAKMRGLFLG